MVVRQAFQSKVNQGFAQRYLEADKTYNYGLEQSQLHSTNRPNWQQLGLKQLRHCQHTVSSLYSGTVFWPAPAAGVHAALDSCWT